MEEKRKVMLVEDEKTLGELMKLYLESRMEGWEIITFSEALTAEKFFLENDVEDVRLMIVDIKLPDKDGIELVNTLRRKKKRDVPVIFITGYINEEVLSKKSPEDTLLIKPFPPEELYDTCLKVIKKH